MKLGERILLAFSRDPGESDYKDATNSWTVDNALDPLRAEFPDLNELVRDAKVVDFGAGAGWQSIALARNGAREVLGVENNLATLRSAQALSQMQGTDDRVSFVPEVPADKIGTYDVVITQNAMEHFGDPEAIVRAMAAALKRGGRLLVTFGPPWLAPSGSHMHFFTRVPWVNVLFAESTVMAVRARYRSDGARRYHEVESGLNQMTVARFERIIAGCGLGVERANYHCVKGLNALGRLPGLREFFINNVSCVLVKK